MTIAKRITQLREERGWTMGELSLRTGADPRDRVSVASISRLESGRTKSPGVRVLAKLAKALDVDPTDFYAAAGYGLPASALRERKKHLSRQEQALIDAIRSAPSPDFRETMLKTLIDLATIISTADMDRHHQYLARAAEQKESYEGEH